MSEKNHSKNINELHMEMNNLCFYPGVMLINCHQKQENISKEAQTAESKTDTKYFFRISLSSFINVLQQLQEKVLGGIKEETYCCLYEDACIKQDQ